MVNSVRAKPLAGQADDLAAAPEPEYPEPAFGCAADTIELPGRGVRPSLPHTAQARVDLRQTLGVGGLGTGLFEVGLPKEFPRTFEFEVDAS